MQDRPTGAITFLFTDIEGSPELWEKQPAQMREALARHDAILRRSIEANLTPVAQVVLGRLP
jgi:class 3 adenylate cyclase